MQHNFINSKASLRRALKQPQDTKQSHLVLDNTILALTQFIQNDVEHRSQLICGIYFAINNEPDITNILNHFDIQFAAPKIVDGEMKYVEYAKSDGLESNKCFRLLQEPVGCKTCIPTIAFVPGLAFDSEGYRLGFGYGHYDKYLQNHQDIYRIGVCFEHNLFTHLPVEDHDCRMHLITTESTILTL